MLLAKLIEENETENQDVPVQIGSSNSKQSLTQRICLTLCQPRRALVIIAALVCLMTMSLPTHAGIAFAQEKTGEESLVEGEVTDRNAY